MDGYISEGLYERAEKDELDRILEAADNVDYEQAWLNRPNPCFHVEKGDVFCGRAMCWRGHYDVEDGPPNHKFVSLRDLLIQVAERRAR